MTHNDIVNLALDLGRGEAIPPREFSDKKPSEVLRQALVDLNGGQTTFDYRNLRRNKVEFFEIIEEVVPVLVDEGLRGDEFFMNLVEERNLASGDQNEFVIEDESYFFVSDMAPGNALPRRQRIGEKMSVNIPTAVRGIRIFDDLERFLAGRIDWNVVIDKAVRSMKAKRLDVAYSTFAGLSKDTPGLSSTYVTAGSFDEEDVLELVEHVEAATGKSATIIGTKSALRQCTSADKANSAKEDLYNLGYYGRFFGTPMLAVKNRHKIGTDSFVFPNDKIFVIAADDKPVKFVTEGEAYIREIDGSNSDMTLEYLYTEKFGAGLIVAAKLGIFTFETSTGS